MRTITIPYTRIIIIPPTSPAFNSSPEIGLCVSSLTVAMADVNASNAAAALAGLTLNERREAGAQVLSATVRNVISADTLVVTKNQPSRYALPSSTVLSILCFPLC
tara:strand:- start:273 stop:590 length:318 start_codon:yes stop_codon:yes gene_type:complete